MRKNILLRNLEASYEVLAICLGSEVELIPRKDDHYANT